MTLLQIMPDNNPLDVVLNTDDRESITLELKQRGVLLDRWPVLGLQEFTANQAMLSYFARQIKDFNPDGRFTLVDAVRFELDDPYWHRDAELARNKFLAEHRHAEDEVRVFISGQGCFYLHMDSEVVAVVATAGDLLSIPAGVKHWFDMGEKPRFSAIRFFEQEDGWVGDFTKDPISQLFPTLDQLVA